jgi:hypothetical protein
MQANVSLPRTKRGIFESGPRARRENYFWEHCGADKLEAVVRR